jgi:hypothetical protein
MLDARRLIELSSGVERVLWIGAALVFVGLLVRAFRGPARATRTALALTPRAERTAIAFVLAWTLATRLAFCGSPQQPRFYFAQATTLQMADALQTGELGRRWLELFGNIQVVWDPQSPIHAPVAAVFQRALGASFELPTFIGAFWGVLAVLLAWRLGRTAESPAFGVIFAAVVAISPLQITWSRIGGRYIGAGAGVLALTLAGSHVGLKRGVVAALVLGVAAWSCVYFYYPARVAMGLAPVALWAGWRRSRRGLPRLGVLAVAMLVGFMGCLLVQRALAPGQSIWPDYQSYLGGRGESSVQDLVTNAVAVVRSQLALSLQEYFWHERMLAIARVTVAAPSRWPLSALAPGMNAGGLVLLPVLIAGMIGLLCALRHPIERGLWLAFAVSGFLPPLVSFPSARRFLVFDLGWCALAALGLLVLLESRLLDPSMDAGRWRWAGALVAVVGVWSAATLGLAAAALPTQHVYLPFGDSGFGDGSTCLACADTGRTWQREIESGRMVIAFDTDMYRENNTSPGGLMLYGKIGALAAGRSDLFLNYYALMANYDGEPARPGALSPTMPNDVADALAARIDPARPAAIVWWFTEPNAWERRLADALVDAGSHRTSPPARPMWGADRPEISAKPLRVETPPERIRDALAALRALVDPPHPTSCVRLERVASRPAAKEALVLAPVASGADGVPEWATASWGDAEVWGREQQASWPIALEYTTAADGRRRADLMEMWGNTNAWTASGEAVAPTPAPGPRPVGRYCVALYAGRWWVVDPVEGALWSPGSPAKAQALDAIGISQLGEDLAIATADQHIRVLALDGRGIVRTFPATSIPARRFHYGECAMLAGGRDWVASLDSLRALISVYDESGAPLGRFPLGEIVGATSLTTVNAIRGWGEYLGVAHGVTVTTLRVVREGACTANLP